MNNRNSFKGKAPFCRDVDTNNVGNKIELKAAASLFTSRACKEIGIINNMKCVEFVVRESKRVNPADLSHSK